MNNRFWEIFNRNMKEGVHRTDGESRSRDVREVLYWLLEHKLFWEGGQILNVGIGDSEEAVLLAQAGLQVTGISNSRDEVSHAWNLGIKAQCMDAHQMTFEQASFDYVYLHDTLEHFIAPIMVFAHCRRVLRLGGILAFHYPTIEDSHNWTHWFIESPRLIFDWILKFGFQLLCHKYEPGASSEYLYIAQKIQIAESEYQLGGNVIYDMLREMERLRSEGDEITLIYKTEEKAENVE